MLIVNVNHGSVSLDTEESPRSISRTTDELNTCENLNCHISTMTVEKYDDGVFEKEFSEFMKDQYELEVEIGEETKLDGMPTSSCSLVSEIHNTLWANYWAAQ